MKSTRITARRALGRLTSVKPASAKTWRAPTCSSPQVISLPGCVIIAYASSALAPFALALVWWMFSDSSGLTKRRAMERDDRRKQDRRDRNIDAMGLGYLHRKRDGTMGSKRP